MERNQFMEQPENMGIKATIHPEPLKLEKSRTLTPDHLEEQGQILIEEVTEVSAHRPTTCVEDREREDAEARKGVPGGSNIYGLYTAIFIGRLNHNQDTFTDYLADVTDDLIRKDIPSGGHDDCAAYLKMLPICNIMVGDNYKAGLDFARQNLGDDFDEAIAHEALNNVRAAIDTGVLDDIDGTELATVLGGDADYVIEKLVPSKHNAKKVVRNQIPGTTIDQTRYRQRSGIGAYIMDDPLADEVEAAVTAEPKNEQEAQKAHRRLLARHGRELLLSALTVALPDEELHGITIHNGV